VGSQNKVSKNKQEETKNTRKKTESLKKVKEDEIMPRRSSRKPANPEL